ncbi:MAG: flippase-like domain-containing protein [Myxococcales bacterium]|nr:flippase-like domain-containing protein [Myxococcales bacterium]
MPWILGLKFLGLAVFAFLFFRSWSTVEAAAESIASIPATAWGAAFLASLLSLLFAAFRTGALLRAAGGHLPVRSLFADLAVATALNSLLIAGVEMVYRTERVRPTVDSLATASLVVVGDRLLGLMVMILATVVLFFGLGPTDAVMNTTGLLLGTVALLPLVGGILLLPRLPERWRRGPERLFATARAMARHPMALLSAGMNSIISFVFGILIVVAVGHGIGIEVPLVTYFYMVPVVAMATVLPVSIGGVGVREVGYVFFLGAAGAEAEGQAVALGLAQYSVFLMTSVVGLGVLAQRHLFSKRHPSDKPPKAPNTPNAP